MTHNKMLKELKQLAIQLGEDFEVIWLIDTWGISYKGDMGIERTYDLRETISIADLYKQFVDKVGEFYESYKSTANFRDLVKKVKNKYFEPIQISRIYQDSYDKFIEEWNKIHPELSYIDYQKKETEKRHRRWDYMNMMLGEMHDVYETNLWPIKRYNY